MIFQAEINECALACLAMIASYHGKKVDVRTLRGNFSTPATGASVKHLLMAANSIELQGKPLKLELRELDQLRLPVVLHWDLEHFVVLKQLSRKWATINDPAIGCRKYSREELSLHFSGIAIELYPLKSFKPEKISKEFTLTQLFQGTPSFYRSLAQVFVLSLLIQLLALLAPMYFQLVIDQGLVNEDKDLVLLVAALFALAVVAKSGVQYLRGTILLHVSSQLGFQLFARCFSHLLRLPLGFFEKREMGDIVSRFSSLENIKQLLTQELVTVIVDGIFSIVTLLLLFIYKPLLAFVVLGFVTVFSLVRVVSIPMEKLRRQEMLISNAKQQSAFMDNVRSIGVTKNYGIENERFLHWQAILSNSINSSYILSHFQLSLSSVQLLLFGLENVLTIYLASMMVMAGTLSIGQLISFIFLKQHFISSVMAMLPKLAELRMMKLELERIADIALHDVETDLKSSSLLERPVQGMIEVRELEFSYNTTDKSIFTDLNFRTKAGDFVVITGNSGSGKSTLLKLLLGLEHPTRGTVLIDNNCLRDFGIRNYRSQISAITHSDVLLSGSLAFNINLDTDPLDQQKLLAACRSAIIDEVILALPMGFYTQIGEMGSSLSAGQVQRVLLARALYRLPKILILDEAFSNIDDETAMAIVTNILNTGSTLIAVTHNPALVEMASQKIDL